MGKKKNKKKEYPTFSEYMGLNVEEARVDRNLSQAQLAALAGIEQQQVSAIEHGRNPKSNVYGLIADALNVTYDELATYSNRKK